MREKNIFDVLEDAEYASMERLIDKCPEISEEQLDRIYAKSEKKFKKIKKGQERTMKDKNIKMTENDSVGGVEHSRRPAWLTTFSTAASIVLIAGVVIGSTIIIRGKHKIINDDSEIPPAVTATTTQMTGTTSTTADNKISVSATTYTVVTGDDANEEAITKPVTETTTEDPDDTEFIKPFVGRWEYQTSPDNNVHRDGVYAGIVDIRSDCTYTYKDTEGVVTSGNVTKYIEVIGGTELLNLEFSGDSFSIRRATYVESAPDELHFGNGGAARIVRADESSLYRDIAAEKMNYYNSVKRINYCGVAHSNDDFFTENDYTYYKVTDFSEIVSLADFKALISRHFTGRVRDDLLNGCDIRFIEKNGVLYELDGGQMTYTLNADSDYIISDVTENSFAAKGVEMENIRSTFYNGVITFTKENGEWKMSTDY